MLRPTSLALALLLAACGGGGGATVSDFPPDTWTWVEVPGTACGDGSPTGLAVRTAPEQSTERIVLVFLMGGGACWGSSFPFACGDGTASAGPYGAEQFLAEQAGLPGSILDRAVPGTPFAGATLVFIPYCTGDVHWGDSAPAYPTYGTADHVWHHAGKTNLEADIAYLVKSLPAPEKVVVAGSSAGGFGSLLAFQLLRAEHAWKDARGYLVDDSGPPLVGADVPASYVTDWYQWWSLEPTLGPVCGTGCQTDLSQVIGAVRAGHPADRLALLSTLQDSVVASFFGYGSGTSYQDALLRLVDQRFSTTTADAHAFLIAGSDHVLLANVLGKTSAGTDLAAWLGQMIHDDPDWTTLGRPEP